MKKLLIYSTALLGIVVSSGCNKFLDKEPDNRAKLNSPEKVSMLLATAYPQANYMAFAEAASDNANDKGKGSFSYVNADPYMFRDVRANQQDSPEAFWGACYTAIAAANLALEAIGEAPDQQMYAAQKGEALVARAFNHFMLVTFFSKVYNADNPAENKVNPGIPYVKVPETVVIKQYTRTTVDSVYNEIERDLLAGLPLIKDETYSVPRYHFNKAAAHAFAARFYLFKKEYQKVIDHASQVAPGGNFTTIMRPWNTTYRNMTYNELWAVYQAASQPANLLLTETSSLWGRSYYTYQYSLDSKKRDTVINQSSAVTTGNWAMRNQMYTAGTNNYMIPKIQEYFVKVSVNAEIGWPYVMVPFLTAEEALFNRAEANAHLGNYSAAISDLNAYISMHIQNYNPATHNIDLTKITSYYTAGNPYNPMASILAATQNDATKAAVVANVLDFKRAEFVFEGMRWFDIIRYNIPVYHYDVVKNVAYVLEPDSKMRVFQIPESARLSGVELNPR